MKILSFCLKIPIYLYKISISPYIISHCRFIPSCSSYAIDALNKLPPKVAIISIIGRILRCNPFNKSDRLDKQKYFKNLSNMKKIINRKCF